MRADTKWRKLGLLGALYFSQGLPYGFFTQALPVLLRQRGFSLGAIGLSSLLALPWALKFLWAPAVDRLGSPRFGRRRSFIVPLQLLSVAVLLFLAVWADLAQIQVMMGAILLLNLLAATQDIATDGLAIDLLLPAERGEANGLQVAGYRVGMIVGGGALLILYGTLGDHGTFLAMAGLTAVATIPIWSLEEPAPRATSLPQKRGRLVHFLRRPGALRLLFLIIVYKAGDAFSSGMLRPFLADQGLSLEDIGWLLGTVGFLAGLLGALLGGWGTTRLPRRTALLGFGGLQALSVAGYAYLAGGTPDQWAIYVLCAFEHFAGGMATAALFTCMMDWSSSEASATDYTVQASAVVIATGLASTVSGFSAERLGYFGHFLVATVGALLALLVVRLSFPSDGAVERIRGGAPSAEG